MAKTCNTTNVITPIHIDPTSFEFTDLNVDVVNLIPTIVPYIVSSFDSAIEKSIEDLIYENLGQSVTKVLTSADEFIMEVVGNGESADPVLNEDEIVNWEDAGR